MAAAKSGDLEELRVAAERNELPPLFIKGQKGDPYLFRQPSLADSGGPDSDDTNKDLRQISDDPDLTCRYDTSTLRERVSKRGFFQVLRLTQLRSSLPQLAVYKLNWIL